LRIFYHILTTMESLGKKIPMRKPDKEKTKAQNKEKNLGQYWSRKGGQRIWCKRMSSCCRNHRRKIQCLFLVWYNSNAKCGNWNTHIQMIFPPILCIGHFQTSTWTRLKKRLSNTTNMIQKYPLLWFWKSQIIQIASFHASQEVGRK